MKSRGEKVSKASLEIPRQPEPIVVSSYSSDVSDYASEQSDNNLNQQNAGSKQNNRSSLLAETRKRLQSFAADVEKYHDDYPEVDSPIDDSDGKERPRESLLANKKHKTVNDPQQEKNGPKQKTLNKYIDKGNTEEIDPDETSTKKSEENSHLNIREQNNRILEHIYQFFKGEYSKIQIILALHKNAGKIYDAMIYLSKGKVDDDPKLLVDVNYVCASEEDKRKYFVN